MDLDDCHSSFFLVLGCFFCWGVVFRGTTSCAACEKRRFLGVCLRDEAKSGGILRLFFVVVGCKKARQEETRIQAAANTADILIGLELDIMIMVPSMELKFQHDALQLRNKYVSNAPRRPLVSLSSGRSSLARFLSGVESGYGLLRCMMLLCVSTSL